MREVISTIAVGDIIEIARHDENGQLNLRRVRVKSVRTTPRNHMIVAENLQGENAWDYRLPLYSWSDIVCKANNIGWFPFKEDKEFDG